MFDVGAIRARLSAVTEESGFLHFDKLYGAAQRKAARAVEAELGADAELRDFEKWDAALDGARRESKRPVMATLGGDLDDIAFERWDAMLDGARRRSRDSVEVPLGADVDRAGFAAYEAHVRRAERLAGHREALKAHLGADVDEDAFRAYSRALDGADRSNRAFGGGMNRVSLGLVDLSSRLPLVRWGAFAAGAYSAVAPLVALAGALGPVLGLLGAVPGLAITAGGALATIMLGMRGVGDALGAAWDAQITSAKDGAAAAARTEQAVGAVAQAQEAAADSEREVTRARRDLTVATEEARRELRELRMEATEAATAEEGAAVALKRARADLLDVETAPGSSALDVREAENAVQRALDGLRSARAERGRLEGALGDAERSGVERSDRVVSARERLADAERAAARASDAAAAASRDAGRAMGEASGGAEKLEEKLADLSPAGREFVSLVQDRFFPVARHLQAVAQKGLLPGLGDGMIAATDNLPVVEQRLGGLSKVIGGVARRFGEALGSDEWGDDLNDTLLMSETLLKRSGDAAINYTDGLLDVTVAADPLFDWLGRINMRLSENFEGWAESGRESGRLERFFEKVAERTELTAATLWDFGRSLVNIGSAADEAWGGEMLRNMRNASRELREWTGSTSGRAELIDWFDRWERRWDGVTSGVGRLVRRYRDLRREGKDTFEALTTALSETLARAIGQAAETVARRAPAIARSFVAGFLEANVWGKLLIGAWLISKLGGAKVIGAMGTRIGANVADNLADSLIATSHRRRGSMRGAGRGLGRVMGRGLALGLILTLPLVFDDASRWINEHIGELPIIKQAHELGEMIGRKIREGIADTFSFGDIGGDLLPDPSKGALGDLLGFAGGGLVAPKGYASGGLMVPPGEDVVAGLRYGEFVMREDAVRRIGVPALAAMNRGAAPGLDLSGIASDGAAAGASAARALAEGLALGSRSAVKAGGRLRREVGGELSGLSDDAERDAKRLREGLVDNVDEASEGAEKETRSMRRAVGRQIDGLGGDADRRTRKMAGDVGDNYLTMRQQAGRHLRAISGATGQHLGEAEAETRRRGRGIRNTFADSYTSADRAVARGLAFVQRATSAALEGLGGRAVRLSVPEPRKLAEGGLAMARGGVVGRWGERGRDLVHAILGRGEAVLNHVQQRIVNSALARAGLRGGLPQVFSMTRGAKHHMAEGGIAGEPHAFAGGGIAGPYKTRADVLGSGAGFVPYMNYLNSMFGPLSVISGLRPGSITTSGNVSNHASGDAVDISTPGGEGASVGSPMVGAMGARMDAAHKWMGQHFAPINLDLLWRTLVGGNHYNHIHSGISHPFAWAADRMRAFISKLPKGGAFGQIPRVKVAGPGGMLRDISQRSIDRARKAADAMVRERSLTPNFGTSDVGDAHLGDASGEDAELMQSISEPRGWNFADWWEVDRRETGHGTDLFNESSGAALRGQFMPGITQGHYGPGSDPAQNPTMRQQIWSMARYIKERYGNPTAAREFHDVHNWYSGGGFAGIPFVGSYAGGGLAGAFSSFRSGVRNVAGGLGKYEDRITSLGELYDRRDRRYSVSEEQLILEPGDRDYDEAYAISKGRFETDDQGKRVGLNYVDEGAMKKRSGELEKLVAIQRKIVTTYTRYMAAVQKIIDTYKQGRQRLGKLVEAARPSRRKRYRDDLDRMGKEQRRWQGTLGELKDRRYDARTDLMSDRRELNVLRPEAESDLSIPEDGGESGGGPDLESQVSELQERLRIATEAARLSDAAVRTLTGPGDIGAGGRTAQAAAANPQGGGAAAPAASSGGYEVRPDGRMYAVGGQLPADPFADAPGRAMLEQNIYTLHPGSPRVFDEIGRYVTAGLGYQGARQSPRRQVKL